MIRVFVYGTLMPGYRNHERFVAPHLLSARPASVRGDLYDLSAGYPAVREGEGIVRGMLLELPDHALKELDELEAYDPEASADANEYYRKEVKVRPSEGSPVRAWIYFMTPERIEEMGGTRVESGLWL